MGDMDTQDRVDFVVGPGRLVAEPAYATVLQLVPDISSGDASGLLLPSVTRAKYFSILVGGRQRRQGQRRIHLDGCDATHLTLIPQKRDLFAGGVPDSFQEFEGPMRRFRDQIGPDVERFLARSTFG